MLLGKAGGFLEIRENVYNNSSNSSNDDDDDKYVPFSATREVVLLMDNSFHLAIPYYMLETVMSGLHLVTATLFILKVDIIIRSFL